VHLSGKNAFLAAQVATLDHTALGQDASPTT
jgi:hypothetical protein